MQLTKKICLSIFLIFASQNIAYALTADGFGDSAEIAKQNAYSTLAQKILSQINTEISQTIKDTDGKVEKSAEKKVSLKSDLILKGVTYQNPDKSFFGEHKVTAVLSDRAFLETIEFYDSKTHFDPMGLSLDQLAEFDEWMTKYNAILQSAPKEEINIGQYLRSAETRNYYIDSLKTAALMKVIVKPSNASLFVNQSKKKPINKPFAISPGEHQIEIMQKDYQTITKVIKVRPGQALTLNETLISNKVKFHEVSLKIDKAFMDILDEDNIVHMLSDYSWQVDQNSPYQFRIGGSMESTDVGRFMRYHLQFDIGVYKNGRKLKKISYKDRVTVKKSDDMKKKIWRKLSKKMHKAAHLLAANTDFEEDK